MKESDFDLPLRNYTGRKHAEYKDQPCHIRVEFHLMYTENGKAIGHGEWDRARDFPLSHNIAATWNITHPKHKYKIAPEHSLVSCTDISPNESGTSDRHEQDNARAGTGTILTRSGKESEYVCHFARKGMFVRMSIA